jgi:L-threonylcarbamoyladenylate synthase
MNNKIKQAAKILKNGGVIAFPTETVFGIGALLKDKKAIKRIFKIKNRPISKPLQILVRSFEEAQELGVFDDKTLAFAKKKWPGPYTLIVPKTKKVSKLITGGLETVGLRIPDHKTILQLIKLCGPIVATSANQAGENPALTAKEVKKILPAVDFILPGRIKHGKASKVIDLANGKILRT